MKSLQFFYSFFLKVAVNLRSSHINHLDVEVLTRKLLFLRVAKYPGLAWDIVKYVSLNGGKTIEGSF